MKKSAEYFDHSAEPERLHRVESPKNPGQIEQVVSSADCRSAESVQEAITPFPKQAERIHDGGAAGTIPAGEQSAEPILTLEDRLLAALAGRGDLSIGQAIEQAFGICGIGMYLSGVCLGTVSDEDFVRAVERLVFKVEA